MKTKRRIPPKNLRSSIVLPILTIVCIATLTSMSSNYDKSWTFNWDGIRSSVKDSIQTAEAHGITSGVVGITGTSTKHEVERRVWIMKIATEAELLQLTKYPGGTIKAIAYEGLLRKKDFYQKTDLMLKAMKDNKYRVFYQSGCLAGEYEIREYLMKEVLELGGKYSSSSRILKNFGISRADQQKIVRVYEKMKSKT